MGILNRLFERPMEDNVTRTLGNVLLSGVENDGSRRSYFNLLMDSLKERKTIIIVNGLLSSDEHARLDKFVKPHMDARRHFDFTMDKRDSIFNVLSAFENSDQKAEFLVSVLSMCVTLPDLLKTKVYRYYQYVFNLLDLKGTRYTLKDISLIDVDSAIRLVEESSLSDIEKNRYLRFLGDSSTYSSYLDIESAMISLEGTGLIEMLSGSSTVSDLLAKGNVISLSGMIGDDERRKETLTNVLLSVFCKCLEKHKCSENVMFLIKDADYIDKKLYLDILDFNSSYNCAAYVFSEDISRFITKNGNVILDGFKSFVICSQGSDENAVFWSNFFGSRDVQEKNYSYTKKKGWNPLANIMDGGGVIASPRKYNSVTTSLQKVNKPIYRPEVFRELKSDEAMIYLRDPLMRRKVRIEG